MTYAPVYAASAELKRASNVKDALAPSERLLKGGLPHCLQGFFHIKSTLTGNRGVKFSPLFPPLQPIFLLSFCRRARPNSI